MEFVGLVGFQFYFVQVGCGEVVGIGDQFYYQYVVEIVMWFGYVYVGIVQLVKCVYFGVFLGGFLLFVVVFVGFVDCMGFVVVVYFVVFLVLYVLLEIVLCYVFVDFCVVYIVVIVDYVYGCFFVVFEWMQYFIDYVVVDQCL